MLDLYKIVLSDDNEGWDFMAVVDSPAHMKPLMIFSKSKKTPEAIKRTYAFNEDEQIIMGVAIATDVPIYRHDEEIGEYNVYFDKEQTRKIGQRMLASGFMHNVNEQHNSNSVFKDIQIDQFFYVDKAKEVPAPGIFKDQKLKDGSLIVSYKVTTKESWSDVKAKIESGEIGGLSIEGWFDQKKVEIKKASDKIVQAKISQISVWDMEVIEDEISIGTELNVDWGHGESARIASGEYMLQDGTKIQVDSKGIVVMIDGNTEENFTKKIKKAMPKSKLKRLKDFAAKLMLNDDELEFIEVETVDGEIIKWDGELAEGTAVFIVADGEDVQAPEGSVAYVNTDGETVTLMIDGTGVVTSIDVTDAEEDVTAEEVEEVLSEMNKKFKAATAKHKLALEAVEKERDTFKASNKKLKTQIKESKTYAEELEEQLDDPNRVGNKGGGNGGVKSAKEMVMEKNGMTKKTK